jgi:hypothetical protein
VYYLGFVLVSHEHRRSHLFIDLIRQVAETLVAKRAMCAYDICSYNNEMLGLADAIGSLLQGLAEVKIETIDTQTYYNAIALGPKKLPEMRSRPTN